MEAARINRFTVGTRPGAGRQGSRNRRDDGDESAELERSDGLIARAALADHVVNLNQGAYSDEGAFETSPEDVERLFFEALPRWLASRSDPDNAHLLFWAHGGLNSESAGLNKAHQDIGWWLANDIYPIYFVWETGLFETIKHLLFGAERRERSARDIWDHTSDPLLERLARGLGRDKVWAGMKRSAARFVSSEGAAPHFVKCLTKFLERDESAPVNLHAVGHSAGSNFHSGFLPFALNNGVSRISTLQLLAPAMTVSAFQDRLLPLVKKSGGIERLTMFTMKKAYERDDSVGPYRKSLLYLVSNALEARKREELLGLETHVRRSPKLRKLFGLNGGSSRKADLIWTPTESGHIGSQGTATSHGGFDDDPPTMTALAYRILGRVPAVEYPRSQRSAAAMPDFEEDLFDLGGLREDHPVVYSPQSDRPVPGMPPSGHGRATKRALCIGIDNYAHSPLHGCINDANLWAQSLGELGFQSTILPEAKATRDGILSSIAELIHQAQAGDVIAIQYAGHGTSLTDEDGDEREGDTPLKDEALVPVDYQSGAYVIDDDLRRIFARIPSGVNVTCFFDCCHSGTMNRFFGVGASDQPGKRRFLPATRSMDQAHRAFRLNLGWEGRSRSKRSSTGQEVFFAACRSNESAWESDGQGHFTKIAVPLLQEGIQSITNEVFLDRVLQGFGLPRRQTPELSSGPTVRQRRFLSPAAHPVAGGNGLGGGHGSPPPGRNGEREKLVAELRKLLEAYA